MKRFYLKSLFLILFSLMGLSAFSYDAEIDGIYYNLDKEERTATVTYQRSPLRSSYTGEVVIPSSFEYDGETYSVTSIGESAFSLCSGLTSVTIPNGVTSIGSYAFRGCI